MANGYITRTIETAHCVLDVGSCKTIVLSHDDNLLWLCGSLPVDRD